MTSITVLIPVLNRPHRVKPVVDSIKATTTGHDIDVLFLVSPGDTAELAAIKKARARRMTVPWPPGPGDYPRKINHGAAAASTEFVFLAADDLTFTPAWADRVIAAHERTDACVIGTNDLGNTNTQTGRHSTHSLVHRDCLECGTADEPGLLLHPGYSHNFCDTEFVETARARGTYEHAADAIVEHLHPVWRKAEDDDTYRRGQADYNRDRRLFDTRRRLWA